MALRTQDRDGKIRLGEIDSFARAVAREVWDQEEGVPSVDCEEEPQIENDGELAPIHPGQRRSWESERRFVAIFAGWRSGKTSIGPHWLLREMQRKGPGDYAIIAPNYPRLYDKALPEFLKILRQKLGASSYRTAGNIVRITAAGQKKLWGKVTDTEVRILLRHTDKAEAIEAFDARGIWVDEPGFIDDSETWQAIRMRVSVGAHRILLTGRPDRFNWYVKEIWNRVMDALYQRKPDADPEIDVINFKSTDNPAFDPAEYEHEKSRMPDWRFLMKFDGIPSKGAGVVYDDYLTIRRLPIAADLQRGAGHDFGSRNTAGLWFYKHPTNLSTEGKPQWVCYSSYLNGNRSAKEHIASWTYGEDPMNPQEVLEERPPEKWRCGRTRDFEGNWTPAVPMAYGGNHTTEDAIRELFTVQGYPIMKPPVPGVNEGIEIAYAALKTREIVFCEDLTKVIEELDNMSNEVDDEGVADQDKIVQKSKWHRMDCLRAFAVGISTGAVLVSTPSSSTNEQEPQRNVRELREISGDEPSGVGDGRDTRRSRPVAQTKRTNTRQSRSVVR